MALDISATSPRVQYTVGSSSTTTFAYGFPIFQEADLKVYVDSTLKTLTTHYSVTGEGTTSGGNVVFGSGLTNCTVTIFRDVEIARTTDFPTSGSFQVGSLNTELDTITAVQQELEDKINRSVRLDDEDSAVAMTLPLKADRIGKILGFNSSTGVPESFVYLTNENTVALDGLTAGTVLASKYVLVDSNKDITGFRNITLSGELDAGSLDVSGDADINGTLEADAITIDGVTLAETIADTVGAMVSSNTETGITVSYEDGDNTLDFALGASQTTITSLLATDIKIGEDNETKIDFETADTINFYAGNEKQLILTDGALTPGSNAILDLGTDALEFKDAYFDGTVEADAYTVAGTALATFIRDTVGTNMLSSNIETGIAVTYDTTNDNIDFALEASQTVFTSITNTGLVIGRDADNDIDFATDNTILFRANGADQLKLVDGVLSPVTDADVDLGSSSLQFKDAYIHGTLEADAITIGGTTLAETIADTVGAMVGSNTETGIAVTYEDSDNTLDFVIGAGSIVNSMLADDAVGADELASNAVVTASIVADAVTGAKIADDQIDSEHYIDGSIDTAHIADDQITQAKMADDAIGADQLASSAVVTASIVDDNVTQAKIADDAVGADQLASSAVVTASIVDNAVTLAKMAGLARGKLITGDSSGDPSALAIGTNGQYLKSDGNDLVWGSATISGLACDDLTVGDSAVTLSTSSGNITIDAQGNDTDIIFKGTDGSSDTTFLTLDGSDAGTAIFNHDVQLKSDDAILAFGADSEIVLSHVHNSGLVLKMVGTADNTYPTLTFQAGDNDIALNDVLGTISFQAPDEASASGDNKLVSAGIDAIAEGDFSNTSNATSLVFKTGASETAVEKMRIMSDGDTGIGTSAPAMPLHVKGGSSNGTIRAEHASNSAYVDYKYDGAVSSGDLYHTATGANLQAFFTNSTERMRIEAGGDIDVQTGDIFFSTAGKGIVLGATSNTDANTLEDYEEGSFTPSAYADSGNFAFNSSYNTLFYRKVGKAVHFGGYLYTTSTNSPSGTIFLGNLPFTSGSGVTNYAPVDIRVWGISADPTTGRSNSAQVYARIINNNTVIQIYDTTSTNIAATSGNWLNIDSSTDFIISGTYFVD